jgi:hypothetical protein
VPAARMKQGKPSRTSLFYPCLRRRPALQVETPERVARWMLRLMRTIGPTTKKGYDHV